jgi:hypothetical protein
MQVRSYRRVFDLERRIYRIDRVRLNPGGIPVRGIVYFLVLLLGALAEARLPVVGVAANAAPWYVRDVAAPAALAALLTIVRVEGRPFHLAARALLRLWLTPRRTAGLGGGREVSSRVPDCRWRPEPILMLPDGSDGGARRLRYTGPGALLVSVAHEREVARGPLVWLGLRSHLLLRGTRSAPLPARGEVVVLGRATRLCVR